MCKRGQNSAGHVAGIRGNNMTRDALEQLGASSGEFPMDTRCRYGTDRRREDREVLRRLA